MIFVALYETDCETDAGTREIEANSVAEAKAILKAQIIAEGNHGNYRLDALINPSASRKREV